MLALLALILIVSLSALAEANGGTLRLDRVPAGPYLLSLWTQPSPPRAGTLDVSVAVRRPPADEAVLDATARLDAELTGRRMTATTTLSAGAGRDLRFYHGDLELPSAGAWRLTVVVEDPTGVGRAEFELDVQPRQSIDWRLLAVAALLGIVAVWWTIFRLRPASLEEGGTEADSRQDGPNGSVRR